MLISFYYIFIGEFYDLLHTWIIELIFGTHMPLVNLFIYFITKHAAFLKWFSHDRHFYYSILAPSQRARPSISDSVPCLRGLWVPVIGSQVYVRALWHAELGKLMTMEPEHSHHPPSGNSNLGAHWVLSVPQIRHSGSQ